MHQTAHIKQRMTQRGITKNMVELALTYGEIQGDKYVLDRQVVQKRLREMEAERRALMKVLDKGGVEVVADDNALITTYNRDSRRNWN